MPRPARRKSLAAEHPGDALVGRSVVADGSIFHQPDSRKFPGRVTGGCYTQRPCTTSKCLEQLLSGGVTTRHPSF